jgi:tetratricopeptide (TPR) repeat protein
LTAVNHSKPAGQNQKQAKEPTPAQKALPAQRNLNPYWLIPCVLALCVYLRALGFGFIFDDHSQIVSNPQVHSWDYLPRLLSTHLWSHGMKDTAIPLYRPVFSVWLLTAYTTLAGSSPVLWHLISILLHVAATYLVFRLSCRLLNDAFAASCAALLFAIHPLHIEAVCWVSSCNELLYTIFILVSLLLFCRKQPAGTTGVERNWSWPSVFFWAAAIFTKESALPVVAVFLYLAYKSTEQSAGWRFRVGKALLRSAPYFATVVIYFAARFLAIQRVVGLERGDQTWQQVFYSAPSIIAFYLKKLVFPAHLSGFYVNPLISAPSPQMWVDLALILLACGILGWFSLQNNAVGVGSMFLFLPMLPVLAGIKVFRQGDLAHDRYMYLPSVGLCILCGIALKYLRTRSESARTAANVAAGLVLVTFLGLTLRQQRFYRNEEAYFGRGVEVNPDNALVRGYLGEYYMHDRQTPLAIAQFNRAHELAPNDQYVTLCFTRGLIASGKYSSAEPYLEQLLTDREPLANSRPLVLLVLGQTEIRLNHLARAEEVLKQLESEDDNSVGLHDTLGALYQLEGRFPEAQKEYATEFAVSGNPASRQKAQYLAAVIRGQAPPPAAEAASPSQFP